MLCWLSVSLGVKLVPCNLRVVAQQLGSYESQQQQQNYYCVWSLLVLPCEQQTKRQKTSKCVPKLKFYAIKTSFSHHTNGQSRPSVMAAWPKHEPNEMAGDSLYIHICTAENSKNLFQSLITMFCCHQIFSYLGETLCWLHKVGWVRLKLREYK